jgi:hypothetical protein
MGLMRRALAIVHRHYRKCVSGLCDGLLALEAGQGIRRTHWPPVQTRGRRPGPVLVRMTRNNIIPFPGKKAMEHDR